MITGRRVIFGQMKLRFARKDRDRRVVATVREKSGADAFAFPPVAFVGHDIDNEMHRFRESFQTGSNRIEARLELGKQTNELSWSEADRWMLDQEIDCLHSPEVGVEVLFSLGSKQLVQERGGGGTFGDRPENFWGGLSDAVIAQERLTERGRFPLMVGHRFFPLAPSGRSFLRPVRGNWSDRPRPIRRLRN